ncbi:GTPase [Ilumatobacter sp.]|uniref:GTPase n=1 Tax=Ilumatobacter sp. TaxID=1967498 RepID=UPI003B5188F2
MKRPRRGGPGPAPVTVSDRIDALERACDVAGSHLDDDLVASVREVVERARARMGHGTEHTVVALAGSTGVGKSSLFNALVGDDVSTVGVRRPTTGVAHAAVWGDEAHAGLDGLLDWLGVGRRHHVAVGRPGTDGAERPGTATTDASAALAVDGNGARRRGLILLDLPDFDSTEASNRAEVDRLVELVDALVWVTDPQKYADHALHDGYVRPLAGHGDVMSFVVNKIDTVGAAERRTIVVDLVRRLRDDGVDDPTVRTASVATGEGLDGVHAMLDDTVDARRVVVARLEADLRAAAGELASDGSVDGVPKRARRELVERLGHAAGADDAGAIVASQHRKDARMAMGWPPARITERLRRRHPISELPRATASASAGAEIDLALRDVAETVAADLQPPWPGALRRTAARRADDVGSRVTASTQASARSATERPGWWTPVAWTQRVVMAAAVVGALWLLVVAVLGGFLQLDADPLLVDTPGAEWIPLPSLLLLGGLALGLLIALVVRIPVGVAATRRATKVRSDLLARVATVADTTVIADLEAVLADRRRLHDELAVVTAR